MALTFGWAGYSSAWDITVGAANLLAFSGSSGHGSPIWVGQWNDALHVRQGASAGEEGDACNPHLTNIKYVDASNASVAGGGSVTLNNVTQHNCLRVRVTSDSTFTILAARLYAFDGVSVTNPPSNIDFKCFEQNVSTVWKSTNGRSSALDLAAQLTPSTDHYFYVGISISPTATGASLSFSTRLEVDIQ